MEPKKKNTIANVPKVKRKQANGSKIKLFLSHEYLFIDYLSISDCLCAIILQTFSSLFFLSFFFCRSQTAMSFTNSDIFLLQHREIGNENETIEWGKITRRPVLNVVLFIAKITAKASLILFCRLYFVSLQTLLSIRFKGIFADKWDRRWNKKILLYFFYAARFAFKRGIQQLRIMIYTEVWIYGFCGCC